LVFSLTQVLVRIVRRITLILDRIAQLLDQLVRIFGGLRLFVCNLRAIDGLLTVECGNVLDLGIGVARNQPLDYDVGIARFTVREFDSHLSFALVNVRRHVIVLYAAKLDNLVVCFLVTAK